MYYKGHYISDDRFTNSKEEEIGWLTGIYSNAIELEEDDLTRLIDEMKKKSEELTNKGIEFNNMHYEFSGKQWEYNPNGADYEAEHYVHLCWNEKESDESYNKRIEKEKEKIDAIIESLEKDKAEKSAREKELNNKALLNAIEIIEKNGGKVKFKHKKK